MEEAKKAAETEFEHICAVAKQEVKHTSYPPQVYCVTVRLLTVWMHVTCLFPPQIARLQAVHVEVLQQALVQWCEKQLVTAKENADQFNGHLQAFRAMA